MKVSDKNNAGMVSSSAMTQQNFFKSVNQGYILDSIGAKQIGSRAAVTDLIPTGARKEPSHA